MGRIAKYTDEQVIIAVKESKSVSEVMRRVGVGLAGGSHAHLTKRIKNLELDTSHFSRQGWNKGQISRRRLSPTELLIFDRRKNGYKENISKLRRAMDEYGFKKICCECGLEEIWNGKQIVLQVDHINGNNLDNRPENLRYICPNCHSQSDNYCWKNRESVKQKLINPPIIKQKYIRKPKIYQSKQCQICNNDFTPKFKSQKYCSQDCVHMSQRRIERPTREELEYLLSKNPCVYVAKLFGVSDNAIRKWMKS